MIVKNYVVIGLSKYAYPTLDVLSLLVKIEFNNKEYYLRFVPTYKSKTIIKDIEQNKVLNKIIRKQIKIYNSQLMVDECETYDKLIHDYRRKKLKLSKRKCEQIIKNELNNLIKYVFQPYFDKELIKKEVALVYELDEINNEV